MLAWQQALLELALAAYCLSERGYKLASQANMLLLLLLAN